MSEVWINDVDLGDYGFVLGQNPAHANTPDLSDASAPLLGQLGPTWLGEPSQAAARKFLVAGHLLTASQAVLLANLDALKALAGAGAVRLRFADRPTQEFRDARLVSFAPTARAAILSALASDLAISFECVDPLRYDVQPLGVAVSTARAALPIGTAASFPVITIHGGGASLTNPVLTYRNASGDIVTTMGFTGTLGANDFLIIDAVRCQVTKSVAGVQSDALSWWTSGDFPVVRGADGWYELAEYPFAELSGTGTPMGLITYSRAWL